ncbi:MAG: hypothetical protein JWP91_3636 [Fibrobacteres bacterium]|nr:hypothetical protein [Fibrobacterota bacterium]
MRFIGLMAWAACAACAAFSAPSTASSTALDPSLPPGGNFALSSWKLQLPVASGGSVQEIKSTDLVAGYSSNWFSTAADGSMSFWCPVTGGTTENSHYPRSELREMWTGGDWTFTGRHVLTAKCRVTKVPDNGRVIIGQIHGHLDGSEIIKLYWDNGSLRAAVEPDRSSEISLALGSNRLGDTVEYRLEMQDGKLKVTAGTKTVTYDYTGSTWKTDTYYFKAGAYVQDNTGTSAVGGQVQFYQLGIEHNGQTVRIADPGRGIRILFPDAESDGASIARDLKGRVRDFAAFRREIGRFMP